MFNVEDVQCCKRFSPVSSEMVDIENENPKE
jgi:hypothetical protein